MMYGVFDNNKAASSVGFPHLKDDCWKNHIFGTLKDAQTYAREWLGLYAEGDADYGLDQLVVGIPYQYNSQGDMIEIREIRIHSTHHDRCPCWFKE